MSSENVFRLYNTATRTVEPVEPLEPGLLRLYWCGPTVYSYAHIGNFRSFLTADLIVRTAQAVGWKTRYVTNITDVGHLTADDFADASGEDKMERALRSKEGERFPNIWDLARYYADTLIENWHALNLQEPDVRPRATEHVTQQIEAIQKLVENGHAYETERGVYFSVGSFPAYGKLSGNDAAEQLENAVREVVIDSDKRDPRDFALWKRDEKHLMQWYSPFGRGFPGWHIECSVMSMAYLGAEIDIHGGGEDLIFPHHECEIAQSESLTGETFTRHWVHTRFLQVEGEKMSKSKGNFYTVRELIAPVEEGGRGVDPMALRYALISGKYREPLNFTFDTLKACSKHVRKFRDAQIFVEEGLKEYRVGEDALGPKLEKNYEAVLDAMLDDLNTPKALAAALGGVNMITGLSGLTLNGSESRSARQWLDRIGALLGIVVSGPAALAEAGDGQDPLAAQVEDLLKQRAEARKARDFARADEIRDAIDALGVEVMDSPEGTKWRRKISV